jgi:N utilization substance protein B
MINRNSIRIKVMQAIYEFRLSDDIQIDKAEKRLMQTFDNIYKLYLQLLAVFGELTHTAEQIIEIKKQKLLPTETDLQPNYKFVDNLFVKKIEENTCLRKAWRKYNIGWNSDLDMLFIRNLYDKLTHTPLFANYMQSHEQSFDEDKTFITEIVEKFLLENEDICNFLGEKNLHWLHDYNDAVILVYNTLKTFTKNQNPEKALPTLFKTDEDGESEDKQFMLDLFRKTIAHDEEYAQFVQKKLLNWEMDRVACIDFILLKMAICEFCEFPSIPLRVTLNEYIEISKYYSTHKSKSFINGMLDSILDDLKNENKINKQGRGLMG